MWEGKGDEFRGMFRRNLSNRREAAKKVPLRGEGVKGRPLRNSFFT